MKTKLGTEVEFKDKWRIFLKKNKILLFVSLLIVFLFSGFLLGFENFNPNNDTWLNNPDLLSYQLPWKYYKSDIWRIPIFQIQHMD